MKKLFNITGIIAIILLLMTSCEKDRIMFDASGGVVGLSAKSIVIKENESGEFKIYLGGSTGIIATDVTLETDIEGITTPAVLGTDFTLSSTNVSVGLGESTITITTIDNDVFTGDKTVKIKIASNSKGYNVSAENTITLTISDDEHPLKNWLGTYTVSAISYDGPGVYDEEWNVTVSPVVGDLDKVTITGISGSDNEITGTIDKDNLTISFDSDQNLGPVYGDGDGDVILYWGGDMKDITWTEPSSEILDIAAATSIVGTISADGSTITIDDWGHIWIIYPWIYDVFNTTWTKN